LPRLSRRDFLGATAGLAAAVALPLSGSSPRAAAANTPLAGATVSLSSYAGATSYVDAAQILDGYVGMPLGTTIQKIYLQSGVFPTSPGAKMTQLSGVGCQFVISVVPSLKLTSSEQTSLANYLAMLTNAGISYRVVLYSEANLRVFTERSAWQAYWSYYAPVIQDAGISLGYCPGCTLASIYRAEEFFPSDPTPDEVWLDFYATSFRGGARIDDLIALAGAAGAPVGLAEWGWYSGELGLLPMTMPMWTLYCDYLANRGTAGDFPLGAMYFDISPVGNNLEGNTIGSASDPRIPGLEKVYAAIQSA
jgi:hypothetical protein